MISFDTETTGVDFRHGAKPFFVTTCDEEGNVTYWEWDVDPETREPIIPDGDLDDIRSLILGADGLVLQNAKFDVAAMATIIPGIENEWPWDRTVDTLRAAHLLASNRPKDLTALAIDYLNYDIEPFEKKMQKACEDARRYCRQELPHWAIAKRGRPDMPSAKEKTWKYDTWLPRVLAAYLNTSEDHPWWTVTRDYANADSPTTIALWSVMEKEIRRRGLWDIYQTTLKVTPVVAKMERRGVTLSGAVLDKQIAEFSEAKGKRGRVCTGIAEKMGHRLELPKNGLNNSLRDFCFKAPTGLLLPELKWSDKTGEASFDKEVLEAYLATLDPETKKGAFLRALTDERKCGTAVSYMESYKRFWLPVEGCPGWWVLYPSLNSTGTATLRFSSSNPNEQNISKQENFNLRRCFGPAPGREWWSFDAKNIELRIPSYECNEREFIDLFERPDDPPFYGSNHLLIFSVIWPDLWQKAIKEVGYENAGPYCKKKYAATYYQWTKNGNFAVQYGAVDREDGLGTADRAYHLPGAQALIKARFRNQEALNQKWISFAERHGYVETMPDRTVDPRHGYPLLCTRTDYGRIKPTVPLNYHVQGTAMWWMIKAMIRVQDFFDSLNAGETFARRRWPGGYYLVMQVHDELVPDMPSGIGKAVKPWGYNLPVAREIQRLMAMGGDDIGVPTPVGAEYHAETWAVGMAA